MQIEIPTPLLKRLEKHAIPFVDTTPASVIERWADFYEQHNKPERSNNHGTKGTTQNEGNAVKQLDPRQPPGLLHTRVRGEFAKQGFSNWNDLVRVAHIQAFKGSFDELRKASRAQLRKGPYSDEGYHYLPEIDVSIQGVDADRAWEYALRLAFYLKVPLRAEVEWRHNEKAAYPGENGVLYWTP